MRLDLDKQPQSEIDADIALFEEMFAAKARFYDDLVEYCDDGTEIDAAELRQDTIYAIAHFFYLLKAFRIVTPDKLCDFALAHNENIRDLLDSAEDRAILGVQIQRLEAALFRTDDNFERIRMNCGPHGIRLSQSDLARFLVEYMSAETCRSAVAVLAKAGYLKRSKSPFGSVLINSTGLLEQLFAGYVRSFREAVGQQPFPNRPALKIVD